MFKEITVNLQSFCLAFFRMKLGGMTITEGYGANEITTVIGFSECDGFICGVYSIAMNEVKLIPTL